MTQHSFSTNLTEIRDFLAAHHCAPAPWEKPGQVIDCLYSSLCEKKEDELFWSDLQDLVSRLEDRRFDTGALAGSLVLQGTSIDKIIDDLRRSLGENTGGNGSGIRHWASRSVGTAGLLAFLILGTATGFGGKEKVRTASMGQWDVGDELAPIEDEMVVLDREIYEDLIDIIEYAAVPDIVKDDILTCLPELDGAYREGLLDLFQVLNDKELASFLDAMGQSEGIRKALAKKAAANDASDDSWLYQGDPDADDDSGLIGDEFNGCCGCGGGGGGDDDDDH